MAISGNQGPNQQLSPARGEDAGELYRAYEGHASILRTWLVAYGIGGPVLLLSNERLSNLVAESGRSRLLAAAFLGGVALQILLAVINKISMWLSYYGEVKGEFKNTKRYRAAYWIAGQFWIDLLFDLGSLIFFAFGTLGIVNVVVV